ncbi:MAG: hypothetical protein R2811_16255 [Flavobacteriales bacterium]
MRYLITACLLLCSMAAVHAQTGATVEPDAQCLFATDEATWMSLQLTSEELDQVQALQTACTTDCTSKKSASDPVTLGAIMDKYVADVRKVLGEERYLKWVQWCKERPAKG